MTDVRRVVARNLQRLRHKRSLTQEALADLAGVDRSYISLLENARFGASVDILGKLAAALDAEVADFFAPALARTARR